MVGGYADPPSVVLVQVRSRTLAQPDATYPLPAIHAMMAPGEEQIMVALRHARGVVAVAVLVAFNVLMFVLAALGPIPMETPFLVAWIAGDAVLSLVTLALTERS